MSEVRCRHWDATAWVSLAVASFALASLARADELETAPEPTVRQQFYGPLRARDLTPFGYLRLDMRPAFTEDVAPGHWALETELGYQNTWALSERVEHYLTARPGRRKLTHADVADIRALPGENYLVDLELGELDVTLHRQFTAHWGAFVVLAAAAYGGGSFDGAIEQFHSTFGISQMGRRGLGRDGMNLVMDLDSLQYELVDAHARNGLLDPTLGVRYSGIELPPPWKLVLEGSVKVPVAGERAFLSTGRADVGVQASMMRRGPNHAWYGSLAVVDYAGSDSKLQPDARVVPTFVFGLESHLTATLHSIVQVYASPSMYGSDDTGLAELTSAKYQLSLGLRYHRGSHLVSFAMTENLENMANTPDVGFLIGWSYRPSK
jgi:hypothetical protein